MERKKVESSNIESIGYDESTEILEVEFKGNPTIYSYHKVPKDAYLNLLISSSIGSFLHKRIKGQYECTRNYMKDA